MLSPEMRSEKNRASSRKSSARYSETHREQARARTRAWKAANPERVRELNQRPEYRDKYLYGMSAEGRAQLLAEQDGRCYLCGESLDLDSPRKIHVDHDHSCCRGVRSCGECVRGLSCEPCNKGIGMFGDDPERMERAAAALRAANGRVAERKRSRPVQGELPLNVTAIDRRQESA